MNREIALVQEKKNPLKNLINLQSCKLLTELFNIEWDIYMKLINLAGCSELVHAEWILPDLTLSWITFPFRWLLSLSLSLPLHTPLNPYTYTHKPPTPCWGSKWSKITHSATQSLLHLALGTDCFISWLFSPLSLLCSLLFLIGPVIGPVFFFLFPYHRNSTKTRARGVELLDLSHCVVCVDLVRPHTSGMCFFYFGRLCWEGIERVTFTTSCRTGTGPC